MALSPVDAAILHHPHSGIGASAAASRVCSVAVARAAALPVCVGVHGPRRPDDDYGLVMLRWSSGRAHPCRARSAPCLHERSCLSGYLQTTTNHSAIAVAGQPA
jgi:hypothetical protein